MHPKAIKLFSEPNIAHIATIMPDGSPQVTAVWVDFENGFITINTAKGRIKHKNIQKDARVAISVVSCTNPLDMASIRGIVLWMKEDYSYKHADKLAKKYMGVEKYPYRHHGEQRIILHVRADHVHIMKRPDSSK
ncbi:MAG: pyridoxamine 5'-phosphate oxidase [Cenarchaeum symbiont of Oopsacas minuta]|nr:pyridoxamine 5'-phosphate oxidase [Cenarchaeum symbiont of Oopsacas minuta]